MFVFKGTAAADASKDENERDWRVTDHYNIQQLGKRPFTTMLQPTLHHRSLTEDTRRPSLPQIRSRSNTLIASQAVPEVRRLSRAPSVDYFTPRSSIDRRSFPGESIYKRGGSSDSFGKVLMAKGSKLLRRQNSKHDLTSLHTLDWLEDVNERGVPQELKPSPVRDAGDDTSPRYNISEPFNFQHLTHTTPQHVERIQKTNEGDLVSEFSAIRAGQAPCRELRGIKTIDLQQGMYFSSSASETSSPPRTGYSDSPLQSPARARTGVDCSLHNSTSPVRNLAGKRSIENFSQPSPSYHTAQTSPTSPPPRVSSRHIAPDFFTFHHEPSTDTTIHPEVAEGALEPLGYPLAACENESYDFCLPHAVTTPDDTALPIRPPPFSMIRTELARVPEEDEVSEERRSSIATSILRPTTPTSSIRHAKSFPSTRSSPQRRSGALPQTTEEDYVPLPWHSVRSVGSVAPCMEEHTQEVPARPQVTRRVSLLKEESWEDVIDYCYEHEAEADCNFDWDLASNIEVRGKTSMDLVDEPTDGTKTNPKRPSNTPVVAETSPKRTMVTPRPTSSTYSSSPPALLPLQTSLPELQPATACSAQSSFSSIPEAATPLLMESSLPTKFSLLKSKGSALPPPVAPLVMPEDSTSESIFDDLYQDMLISHAASDYQLLFSTGRVDGSTISNSPRSSRSPISKSSSQESFWHVQARRHRNTDSVGSLPDLVQSRSNEKSDTADDRLADHAALLSTSDASADNSQRRRSPCLAKDVALKSILSKAMNPEAGEVPEVPLALHPAFRERANSDAGPLLLGPAMVPPPSPMPARMMRSTSSASSLSSRKANRVSYSLFPTPATR